MGDFDEKLIEAVRRNDLLYNKNKSSYKQPELKAAAWRQIAEKLGVTAEECTRRWSSLRDRFGKELRRMDAPSGSGAINTQPWALLESLMFLKDFVKPRRVRTSSNILEETESSFEGLDDEGTTDTAYGSPTGHTQVPKKRKLEEVQQEFKEAVGFFKDFLKSRAERQEKEDDTTHLLKAIEVKVHRLSDPTLKRKAVYDMLNYCTAMEDYAEGRSDAMPNFNL